VQERPRLGVRGAVEPRVLARAAPKARVMRRMNSAFVVPSRTASPSSFATAPVNTPCPPRSSATSSSRQAENTTAFSASRLRTPRFGAPRVRRSSRRRWYSAHISGVGSMKRGRTSSAAPPRAPCSMLWIAKRAIVPEWQQS
jgi:hypothetical protein